ncbi:MAG TPA: hypothetical protein VFV52_04015 [Bacilli bacterium]|nr:hypothetical protein [Bacilli bacterium]
MNFLTVPVVFGENEWFILISIFVFAILWMRLPKRFPTSVTLLIVLFNSAFAKATDYTIAASLPYDLYDYNDTKYLDLFDEGLHFLIYPLCGYLEIYWYDVWRARGFSVVLFVLLMAALATSYEWISVMAGVFTYKGWKIWYSALCYVAIVVIDLYVYQKILQWQAKSREQLKSRTL